MNLETKRLVLDEFKLSDAKDVIRLAGDIRVASMTAGLPHPYKLSMAQSWISDHGRQKTNDHNHIFAIRLKEDRKLIGCINICFNKVHDRGYVGYWSGVDYWGKGYGAEALKAILSYGFSFENVVKIWAEYKAHNLPSGRVMEKLGMIHEGIMRKHFKESDDSYADVVIKSILREEFLESF